MDFGRELDEVGGFLRSAGVPFAVVGGYLARLDGVDRHEIRAYFEKHGLADRWAELARSL